MTKEQAIAVLKTYSVILASLGFRPVRDTDAVELLARHNHVAWVCEEAMRIFEEGRIEKGMRWLGWIQGAMWAYGLRTISQAKNDNKPPDETFDPNRV